MSKPRQRRTPAAAQQSQADWLGSIESGWEKITDTITTVAATLLGLSGVFSGAKNPKHPELMIACWAVLALVLIFNLSGKVMGQV